MPHGKPAGIPCVQLLPDYRCALFGRSERPAVCVSLRPTEEMCGANREHALRHLTALELATRPPVPEPVGANSEWRSGLARRAAGRKDDLHDDEAG